MYYWLHSCLFSELRFCLRRFSDSHSEILIINYSDSDFINLTKIIENDVSYWHKTIYTPVLTCIGDVYWPSILIWLHLTFLCRAFWSRRSMSGSRNRSKSTKHGLQFRSNYFHNWFYSSSFCQGNFYQKQLWLHVSKFEKIVKGV